MAASEAPQAAAQTVAAYLADWLDLQATQLEPSSWQSYAGVVHRYLIPGLGEVPLSALSPAHLNPFYARLLRGGGVDGAPLSLRTVQYCHDILRKACGDARRMGLLAANPCVDATVPRQHPDRPDGGRREMTVWTPAELRTFLDAAADHPLYNLWVVAAGTGMRRGELLALAWGDVNRPGRKLVVRHALSLTRGQVRRKAPKGGRARTLSFDRYVAAAFARERDRQQARRAASASRWSNGWDLVFTDAKGRSLHPDGVSRSFRELVASLALPDARLHDLRHSHATHMLAAGVPVKVVSDRLGHASAQLTLDVYAHVLPAMDVDAVDRYTAHVHGDDEGERRQRRPADGGS
jgi:integrase